MAWQQLDGPALWTLALATLLALGTLAGWLRRAWTGRDAGG